MICLTNERWEQIKAKLDRLDVEMLTVDKEGNVVGCGMDLLEWQAHLQTELGLERVRARSRKDSLIEFLKIQADWSARTFGPGKRTVGICNHIRSELDEIEAEPDNLEEWIDVIVLALDATWRLGATPESVVRVLMDKQQKNLMRSWGPPPPEDQPSFHLKE